MKMRNLTANKSIFDFILTCLVFGFLVVGNASAMDAQSGSWTDKKYSVDGNWSIEKRGDQQVIVFDDSFNTKTGPDLKLFLSPASIDTVTGKNATEGSVLVSALKSNKGAQEYVIPADININDYQSLLIHCEQYSVLWGGTGL